MGPFDDVTIFSRYQTFFVGLLGFLGVMATLWWNARLARVARREAVEHERATLRTAMLEELKLVRGAFELRIEQFSQERPISCSFVPKKLPIALYAKLVDRIGILTKEEVAAVMHAYGVLEQLPERVRLISKVPTADDSPDFFEVPSAHFDILKGIHESYLKVIVEAIEQLEAKVTLPQQ